MKIEKVVENLALLKETVESNNMLTFPQAASMIGERRDNVLRLFYLIEKENNNILFLPGKAPIPSVLINLDETEKKFIEILTQNLDAVDSSGNPNDLIARLVKDANEKGLPLEFEQIVLLTRKFLRKYRINSKLVPTL